LFALYLTSLTLSAGLVGLFFRQLLHAEGYVPGLAAGLALSIGTAAIYIAMQFAYMAAVQLLKPTRSAGPLFAEFLSHTMALVLVPYLVRLRVPWPHELLGQVEPLVYLGLFAAGHGFFKLMSFFAAMRGLPAGRLQFARWLLGAVMSISVSFMALAQWVDNVERLRPAVQPAYAAHGIGEVYCLATAVPEGASLATALEPRENGVLTVRVAAPAGQDLPATLYLQAYVHGRRTVRYTTAVRLPGDADAWTVVRIPAEFVPADATGCDMLWSSRQESRFQKLFRMRPVVASTAQLLVSGPYVHEARVDDDGPSFVLVSIEGLSAAHMSTFGYDRRTTPFLSRFADQSLAFANAYTPSPDAYPATTSVLTGLDPLDHMRFSPDQQGPPEFQTLVQHFHGLGYTTALFDESDDAGSPLGDRLSGFDQGFEYLDTRYAAHDSEDGEIGGSTQTLERARLWIDANAGVKFFLFVRLQELSHLTVHPRYGQGLTKNLDKTPPPKDIYDSVLAHLDTSLGAFLKYIRDRETRRFTCVTVFAPYGVDFVAENGKPSVGLTENALRVPLMIQAPGLEPEKRDSLVTLTQIAPTLLEYAGSASELTSSVYPSLLDAEYAVEPVAVTGDPIVMLLRNDYWHFVWNSGLSAATLEQVEPEKVVGLYQITRRRSGYTTRDATARNARLVQAYREKLMNYAGMRSPDEAPPE
jgi:hypothetical protein